MVVDEAIDLVTITQNDVQSIVALSAIVIADVVWCVATVRITDQRQPLNQVQISPQ